MKPDRTSLSKFLDYLSPYKALIGLAVFCGIIRYLIPIVMPWTIKILVDDYLETPQAHSPRSLHLLMISLTILYLFYGLVSYWRSNLAGMSGHKIIFDLRQKLYLHVQQMSLSFFDRQKIGAVVSHMTSDIAAAQNFVGSALINTAMDLSCVTAIILLLVFVHWKLALVSLSVLPFYAYASYSLTKRIKAKSRAIHAQMQEISGELHEQFASIATIQSFTQEENQAEEFKRQSEKFLGTMLSSVKLQSIALGITGFLTAFGPILVLWYGVTEVWASRLSIGTLMAFYAYLGMLYQPIQRLTDLNLILINSLAAMDRIFKVFDTYPEVRQAPGARELKSVRGRICFEHVTFHYDQAPPEEQNGDTAGEAETKNPPVLCDFNLDIPAGKSIALVGPSGAGKSTLIKLLPRFYDVSEGRITLDGIDIRQIALKSLRRQLAILAQEPVLLSGTIAENIRYGRPEATDAQIREAARAAFADIFIEEFPEGYNTEVGERGLRLSGGQKQRIAIARALLKNAPIVVLDEPTSALDPESEELIKQALRRMLAGRTSIIIAHRLSTIEYVDQVVVMSEGRIIEQGRHEELLKSASGLYRKFAEHQLSNHFLSGKLHS